MKKFIILFLVVVIITMFSLPTALSAAVDFTITIEKTHTGFDSGDFEFEIWWDNPDGTSGWEIIKTGTIAYDGSGSETFTISIEGGVDVTTDFRVVESGTNGATGVVWSFAPGPNAQNGVINNTTDDFTLTTSNPKTVYFDNIKKYTQSEPPVWVRDTEMKCKVVWINEDNMFQFSFIYPYADNNWVRIYDMDGNMVYEVDMPYDNPNIIVDLPDGMYTVKTFHDQPDPIQTFVIGKP